MVIIGASSQCTEPSTALSSLREKVLSAYLLEALGHAVDRSARPLTVEAAKGFLMESRKAQKVRLKGEAGRSINFKAESQSVIGSETIDSDTGESVRETYIAK